MEEMYRPGELAKMYPKKTRKGYDEKTINKKSAKVLEDLIIKYKTTKPDRVI